MGKERVIEGREGRERVIEGREGRERVCWRRETDKETKTIRNKVRRER